MMDIMVIGASPEWEEVMQAPGEIIAAVRIDGLEEAESNPSIHRQDMKILSNGSEQDWKSNSPQAEHHHFYRRRVFCCNAKWS